MLAAGQFREDLYYRLNVVPIFLPPLRERREDIPALVDHFARRYAEEAGRAVRFTPAAVALLAAQEWPGNVRELENAVERTVVLSNRGVIDAADLKLLTAGAPVVAAAAGDGLPGTVHDIELRMLREALEATTWRQAAAARRLGITPRQIGYRIRKYGLAAARRGLTSESRPLPFRLLGPDAAVIRGPPCGRVSEASPPRHPFAGACTERRSPPGQPITNVLVRRSCPTASESTAGSTPRTIDIAG